jgi:DNA-binding MarR family transcriptional regulator
MRYNSTPALPGLDDSDFQTLAGFRLALRRFFSFSEDAAVAGGMTPQQYQAMLAVRSHGGDGLSMGTLAGDLMIRHHSAVGLVDRLEARGLVARAASREDGRIVLVTLTKKGREALESLAEAHRAELRRMRGEMITLLESLG